MRDLYNYYMKLISQSDIWTLGILLSLLSPYTSQGIPIYILLFFGNK